MFDLDKTVKTYLVELYAKREDGQEARAYMKLFLNDPPRNGTCTISPSVGVATEVNFQVTCSGWIDEDGIESYRVYGKYLMCKQCMYIQEVENWPLLSFFE